MASLYLDTSALVKRYVEEVGSPWLRRLVARPVHQVVYTAALTEVEMCSALQRLVRERRIEASQAQRLTQRLVQHCTHRYHLLRVTRPLVTQAGQLVERHPLRAYDAVQLACALAVRRLLHQYHLPAPLFVAADEALLAAAHAEGFMVANPLAHS
jgi:hypothetical protein